MLPRDGVPPLPPGLALSAAERRLADTEAVFKALAHAQRRQILMVLRFRGGEMTAGEIADRFACSWPTTTRHLKVLMEAGLVTVAPRGRERVYALAVDRLRRVAGGWLAWFDEERFDEERFDEEGAPGTSGARRP